MANETDDPENRLDKDRERLHRDVQELARLRESEHRLEERIEGDVAEIERMEEDCDFEVIVNGEKKTVRGRKVTFEEAVELAFPRHSPGPNVSYTVTYRMAADRKHPEGSLVEGGSVRIKDGTRFHVKATDKS